MLGSERCWKRYSALRRCHQMSGSAKFLTQKAKIIAVSSTMHITGKEKTLRGHDGVELLVGGSAVPNGKSDECGTDSALTSLLVISEHI